MKFHVLILLQLLSLNFLAQRSFYNSQLCCYDSLKISFIPTSNTHQNQALSAFFERNPIHHVSLGNEDRIMENLRTNVKFNGLANQILNVESSRKKLHSRNTLGNLTREEFNFFMSLMDNSNVLMLITNLKWKSVLKQNGKGKTSLQCRIQMYHHIDHLSSGVWSYLEVKITVPYAVDDDSAATCLVLNEYQGLFNNLHSSIIE